MKRRFVFLTVVMGLGGCAPYTVGTTAHVLEPGQKEVSATFSVARYMPGEDAAIITRSNLRYGIDERSEGNVGFYFPVGLTSSYKRQLNRNPGPDRPAVAGIVGIGAELLSMLAYTHITLVVSGSQRDMTPYGGVRMMTTALLSTEYEERLDDYPHALHPVGLFAGVLAGDESLGISPEIGVFYDPTAASGRAFVVVPAITIHGEELLEKIGILASTISALGGNK